MTLFVPFRYASDGYKNSEGYQVHARLTFLLPLLSIKLSMPSEQKMVVTKVFGIPLKGKQSRKQQKEIAEDAKDTEPNKEKTKSKKKKRKVSFVKDIEYYVQLWQDDKELILDVFQTIVKALATILPNHVNARVIFGTGMADVTGFIYAFYCALESYLPGDVSVEPVWIEKHLEGEYKLRGKIRLFPLLVAFIKIISNQNVRILYKKLRRV